MGRSQVLYNRTKGRFRNKVRNQSQQQQSSHHDNDQHPRGYHAPPRQETEGSSHGSYEKNTDNSHKKRSRNRSAIGQNTTINESEMMLLASSAAPQYYVEDDSSTIFGVGATKSKEEAGSFTISSSSLDISSLETTLLTCVSISDRLKLPSHVAQTLQKEGSPTITTTTSNIGFSPAVSPARSTGMNNRYQGGEEKDSEEIIRNARIRKQLLGESPTKSSAPPSNVGSPEFTEDGIREDDSFLASLTVYEDEEENVIRPSYSGIKERGRVNLPASPSLVYQTQDLQSNSNKKEMDDASYSIGPNKIKATEQGDIEVRIKKNADDDDASGMSREFDVDRYAVIDEDDEDDSFMTSDQGDTKQSRLPSSIRNVHVPAKGFSKTRNKVAAVSARAGPATTGGKLDPPSTTLDPPAGGFPPLQTDPSDDSEMLENWLDSVVGADDDAAEETAASSAAVHPTPKGNKQSAIGPPVSTVQGSSQTTATTTTMPKEVTIPQRPVVGGGIPSNSTAVAVDPLPAPSPKTEDEEEVVEDTLESWLDDVIM